MLLYLFLNWWLSTFNCSFPGGFCHSVPPGLSFWFLLLVVFHFSLFPGGFYHSEPPGPIVINDTSWTVSVGRIEVQSCLFGEFGVFERCRTDSSF